ncbi:MAG: ABC transporter substrate-binding protein, partial [Chloroflexi bacterium]|nr:ABC transporter substrate-binding protein [Chloroflexota bacterium]
MKGFSVLRCWSMLLIVAAILAACAAPTPTTTPTQPPALVATPTKAPTATPTKRPLVKVVWAGPAVSTAHLPVWVAKGAGYFPEEGLDVDWVFAGSGAKGVAAVIGGSATWASAASPDLISAISQNQPIQAFAGLTIGQLREIVMRKDVAQAKGVTEKSTLEEKVKALRGLRLGATSPGSGTDYTLRYILMEYGMDPERDVEIVYVGSPAGLVAALNQGSIDVFANNDP